MVPNSNGRSRWESKPQTLLRGPISSLTLAGVQTELFLNARQAAPIPSAQSEQNRDVASRDMCVPEVVGGCNVFSKRPKASSLSLKNAGFHRAISPIDLEWRSGIGQTLPGRLV